VVIRRGTFPSFVFRFIARRAIKRKTKEGKEQYHAAVHPELDQGQAKRHLRARHIQRSAYENRI